MPLTYQGNDMNALELICAEFSLPAPGNRATRVEIDAAAAAGGVELVYAGSDRNALELLYDLLAALPVGPACAYMATYVLESPGYYPGVVAFPSFNAGTQTVGYNSDSSNGSFGGFPDVGQPASGVLELSAESWPICELDISLPSQPDAGHFDIGVVLLSSDAAVSQGVKITRSDVNVALLATSLSGNYGDVHDATAMVNFRLGIYVNGETGQVGRMIDGVDAGYFTGTPFAGKAGIILCPIGAKSSTDLDGNARMILITDPAEMVMVPPCSLEA